MDFFERQDRARRKTGWLILYFILAIGCITAALYAVCLFLFADGAEALWNPSLLTGVATATLLVISGGSLTKTIALRQGGGNVARLLGGRLLEPNSNSLDEQRLQNVVEEMAIASGTPVPEIYILENEPGINAFAAGHTTSDAAIGVTAGTLRTLTRDELQGVIAHEFSHILNGDMRLNLRLMGLVHGILCLTIIGRILLRTGSGRRYSLGAKNRGGSNPLPLLGLALIILGSIGVFFGRLIKSAVSRQREFLADASAVQFTRNPSGLAGALKKIGALTDGSRLRTPNAEEASHLFFSNGLRASWLGLLATHPPLIERIRALEPEFDGNFNAIPLPPSVPTAPPADQSSPPLGAPAPPPPIPAPQLDHLLAGAAAVEATSLIRAEQAVAATGQPSSLHLVYAAAWRSHLSPQLIGAAHDVTTAQAVIYALLLSQDPATQARQLAELAQRQDPSLHHLQLVLAAELAQADRTVRLPLVDLCLNALRQATPTQYQEFIATTRWLIEQDRQVDLFEFTLQQILIHHLAPFFQPSQPRPVQYYSLRPLLSDCRILLSALAGTGHHDPAQIERAFRAGYSSLDPINNVGPLPLAGCDLATIDAILDRLAQASPQIKKRFLNAAALSVASDGMIQPTEAELLRAIADCLDCPIPPFLQGVAPVGPFNGPTHLTPNNS